MKNSIAGFVIVALVALTGCNRGTPGGPGATQPESDKRSYDPREADDSFRLSMPFLSTSLKQGEAKAFTIGIKRGKNFDQDVALHFADMPRGVTLEPDASVIKSGDTEAKMTLKAADDASLGSFTVKVTGRPTKGGDAVNELKINVAQK